MSESKVVRVDVFKKRLRQQLRRARTARQKAWGFKAYEWTSRILTLREVLALLRELEE